jgi:hypothetical protein
MTTIEAFQRSIELEAAIAHLNEAQTPRELVRAWCAYCDDFQGHARKLAQAAYSRKHQKLTGALAL